MARFWAFITRVVRSYGIEEKVLSLVLLILIIITAVHGVLQIFRSPQSFLGGYYTEGIIADRALAMNPLYEDFSEANRDVSRLIFSGLTKYDPATSSFIGDLAEYTISEDKKNYKFVLKEGIFWHDLKPVTADDVFFTFHDIIQNENFQNPVLRANFEGIQIKKIDSRTIEFTLKRPNSFFITNTSVGLVPQHILGAVPIEELPYNEFNQKPVGTGPYKFADLEMTADGREKLVLNVNDNYYGIIPKIKSIKFNIYPDALSLGKEQNTLDVISRVPNELWDEINKAGRFTLREYGLPQYSAVFFNMDNSILKNPKIRTALSISVDKDLLMSKVKNKIRIESPFVDLEGSDLKPLAQDIENAKVMLSEAGYRLEKDTTEGFRKDSKGNPLTLNLIARQYLAGSGMASDMEIITLYLQEQWRAIGIDVKVTLLDPDTFTENLRTKNYDMVLTGQSLGYNLDTFSYWHSSQAGQNGLNLSNYRSFVADALIEKIRDSFVVAERAKLLKELSTTITADKPLFVLFKPSYVYASDNKVRGVELKNIAFPADRFANIEKMCVNCD